MSERNRRMGASSVARVAGNILSGIAANPEHRACGIDNSDADVAFDLAVYLVEKAEAWEKRRGSFDEIEVDE